jgi:hypothetical protein
MEMAVRSMETVETAMETDGDDSGGTSPSRQGAGIETYVPQNSSAAAAELQNSFWKFPDSFRVFHPEAFYRRNGIVRGGPGWPNHGWVRLGAVLRTPVVWPASGPPPALIRSLSSVREK